MYLHGCLLKYPLILSLLKFELGSSILYLIATQEEYLAIFATDYMKAALPEIDCLIVLLIASHLSYGYLKGGDCDQIYI